MIICYHTLLHTFYQDVYSEADLGAVPIANQPEIFLEMCDFLETEGKMDTLTDKFILNKFEEEESIAASSAYDTEQSYANDVFNEVLISAYHMP